METIPSSNARRSLEVPIQNSRCHDLPILCYTYMTGRMLMISIVIYFLSRDISDGLDYPYHWLGFLTIHMILECSATYSDPLWNLECIEATKIHIHWIFAVAALILGTVYFYFRKLTLFSVFISNSTDIASSSNNIEPRSPWHCAYSYPLLSLIQSIIFVTIFVTGVVIFASARLRPMYLYRFHKCGGTLATYNMIVLLACNVFSLLSTPMNWIIFLLTIVAFVLMPIRIFADRPVNNQ